MDVLRLSDNVVCCVALADGIEILLSLLGDALEICQGRCGVGGYSDGRRESI